MNVLCFLCQAHLQYEGNIGIIHSTGGDIGGEEDGIGTGSELFWGTLSYALGFTGMLAQNATQAKPKELIVYDEK